ncbi:MAG TPA: hypothetical protein VMT11_11480 [Myxococcaceae bacterium]|nr:hypothetical protein [Myxococcaceae bacterium]
MTRFRRTWLVATVLGVSLQIGCKPKSPPPATPSSSGTPGIAARDLTNEPGNTYKVTYAPNTVVIPRATVLKAIQSVSTDGTVVVFDEAEPSLQALVPGKVMLLERIALRRVKAVQRDGGHLAILTEPTTLPEAIQQGTIRWNVPVRFATLAQLGPRPALRFDDPLRSIWRAVLPVAHAATPHSLSGEKNGWKYTMTATPGPSRVNLGLSMTKSISEIEVSLDANGYVPDFDTLASIEIFDGAVKTMDMQNKNLSGEVQLNISAATKGSPGGFGKKQVRLPAILKAPFFLGALPLTLEITTAITFTPGLGANHQLATAKFRASYSDLKGFSFQGGNKNAASQGGSDGDGEILDAKGVTLAGIGVVAGISMPRLEFKLGTGAIVDMLENALPTGLADVLQRTLFGSFVTKGLAEAEESIKTEGAAHVQVVLVGSFLASGPTILVPCQKTTFNFRADAGADASVLGKALPEISVDLFKKEIVKTDPPNIKCG